MARDGSPATLPPYALRRSRRARHVRLVVSRAEGLVVVVPARFDAARVPALLATRVDWIERSFLRLGVLPAPPLPPEIPLEVVLGALGERWPLDVRAGHRGASAHVVEEGGRLVLHRRSGAALEESLRALRAWLAERARAALVPRLAELAEAQSLAIGAVTVRAQRTRWASCSARGNISLNRALLFLPPELVDHVLHHELAHRHELNHSPRFRALLLAMDPDMAVHEAALRTAWTRVPRWAS